MDTSDTVDATSVDTTVATKVSTSGDTKIGTSLVGVVNAEGGAEVSQSGALAIVSQADVEITQGGAAALISKSVSGENVGSGIILASDVSIARGWVGIVASPKVELSEDSRVLIGPVAALIIVAAIFGVIGIAVAIAAVLARRAMQWRPRIPVPSVNWKRPGE